MMSRYARLYFCSKQSGQKKNIVFEIDLDGEVSCTCNESLMLHVWTNLLDNAIKFNSEGGTIKMESEITEKNGSIIFTIADNGCGIAEEDCKHISRQVLPVGQLPQGRGQRSGTCSCKAAHRPVRRKHIRKKRSRQGHLLHRYSSQQLIGGVHGSIQGIYQGQLRGSRSGEPRG